MMNKIFNEQSIARPVMKVKKVHPDAVIPSYAHDGDSGLDLYTVEDVVLAPKATGVAPTGIIVSLPPFTELQVRNRSGITVKGCKCTIVRTVVNGNVKLTLGGKQEQCAVDVKLGTVDNPYRGEIGIIVTNNEDGTVTIPKGTKLAQAVVCPVIFVDVEEVDELSETSRGDKGYGSTGV